MPDNMYSTSSTLQAILASKKAEARQAMIDSLNQKNVASEISARDENAKSMAEQRQAISEDRILKGIDSGGMEIGSDASTMSPETLSVAEKFNRIKHSKPSPTPSVTTSDEGNGPVTDIQTPLPDIQGKFWAGSPDQQKRDRVKHNVTDLMAALQAHPDMSPSERLMRLHSAFEDSNLDAGSVAKAITPEVPDFTVDAASGKANPIMYNNKPVSGAHVTVIPRPPLPRQAPSLVPFVKDGNNYWGDPRDKNAPLSPVLMPPTAPGGAPVPASGLSKMGSGSTSKGVSTAEINSMKSALTAFGKAKASGAGLPEAQANLTTTQANIINNHLKDESSKQFVRAILSYPKKDTLSVDALMKMTDAPMSPEQHEAIYDVLTQILGRF